jgi:6-phospho-beta-glucosidase
MARIKVAYVGGGSTRGPGTVASFVEHGANFEGSEIVLIDLDPERLDLVQRIGTNLARTAGVDLTITATTDRAAGLADADAVLTSFRPGGFEARVLDERLPLAHDVIGQETQGPGGFFMALRSVAAMQDIIADMERVAPKARIFNYTNPVNIVAQAIADNTDVPIVSLCEGPWIFPAELAEEAGLDPAGLDVVSVGLNHGSWSIKHEHDGRDLIGLLQEAWERRKDDPALTGERRLMLRLAAEMESLPSFYFQYYYFERETLAKLKAKPTTRAEDILAEVPDYWQHYVEQAGQDAPQLDPKLSRGGLQELELAVDAIEAVHNDTGRVLPVNVPNQGSIPGWEDSLVVETLGRADKDFITPLPQPAAPPRHVRGLVEALAEYQVTAAQAAWSGTRTDAVRALAAHPLVRSLEVAGTLYDEMALALREHLPSRLLPA